MTYTKSTFCRTRFDIMTVVVACVVLSGCSAARNTHTTATPRNVPELGLDRYAGKVVYVDFWASWCGPCAKSFPWMQSMQTKYDEDGLVILAVNLDRDRAAAAEFLAHWSPDFEMVYDPLGNIARAFDVGGMPCSFLIDRLGMIRTNHVGFRDGDGSKLERTIVSLLREKNHDANIKASSK